jgi:hypothetical protein
LLSPSYDFVAPLFWRSFVRPLRIFPLKDRSKKVN